MHILVLESSTTSAKAMLYNTDDYSFDVKTSPYTIINDDVTTHDADEVFMHTVKVGREISRGKDVDIIALCGTWHSVMLLDKNMKPVTKVFLWSHMEAADICKELRKDKDYVKNYYGRTGCMVNAIYPAFELMLLKQNGYNLNDYYISGQGTYNTYRLTGEYVVTESMASGSGLLNIYEKSFDKDTFEELGISENQFGRLVDYKNVLKLSKEGAELLGLKEGIPVIAAHPDGGLNQVGAGALKYGVMTFSVGTSGAMRLTASKPVIPETPSTWCYLSPKSWLSGAATSGCCNCIDWLKSRMFSNKSYSEIEKDFGELETSPIFLPFLFGERCPGWQDERNAAFFDVKNFHTERDLYYAVQQGVLFNLYQCYKVLTDINGIPNKIKLSGGILHSKQWTQMCADIFGIEMERDDIEHGSLLGGAVLAMEIIGVIDDARNFSNCVTTIIKPNLYMTERYNKKFEQYLYWYNNTV